MLNLEMVKLTDGATALDWIGEIALEHLLLIFFKLTLGWSAGVHLGVCLVGGIDSLLLSFYKHFSLTDFQIALCPDSSGMAITQSCFHDGQRLGELLDGTVVLALSTVC